MTYVHTATVRGWGHFPIDMLRYDNCFPASEADSAQISNWEIRRDVRVRAVTTSKLSPFTPKRWESFHWPIVGEEVVRR